MAHGHIRSIHHRRKIHNFFFAFHDFFFFALRSQIFSLSPVKQILLLLSICVCVCVFHLKVIMLQIFSNFHCSKQIYFLIISVDKIFSFLMAFLFVKYRNFRTLVVILPLSAVPGQLGTIVSISKLRTKLLFCFLFCFFFVFPMKFFTADSNLKIITYKTNQVKMKFVVWW